MVFVKWTMKVFLQIDIVICLSSWLPLWWSYRSKWICWGRGWCDWQCHRSSSWRPWTESSASAQVQWIFGQSQAGVSEEEKEWEIAKGSPTAVAGLVEQTLQVAIPIGIYNLHPCWFILLPSDKPVYFKSLTL